MFFKTSRGSEWLIVGLGNPGKQYEQTRHNAGFRAVDAFCDKQGIRCTRARFSALTGSGTVSGAKVIVLKPTTFMNLSGQAVKAAADYHKIPPERIVVVYDDISLEPGHLRIRADGSAGGHNGMKDIIQKLGSDKFPRVKIGVGKKPHPDYDLADWVLSTPSAADKQAIASRTDDVVAALELIVKGDLTLAQSRHNK